MYHSTLGMRVIKKEKKPLPMPGPGVSEVQCYFGGAVCTFGAQCVLLRCSVYFWGCTVQGGGLLWMFALELHALILVCSITLLRRQAWIGTVPGAPGTRGPYILQGGPWPPYPTGGGIHSRGGHMFGWDGARSGPSHDFWIGVLVKERAHHSPPNPEEWAHPRPPSSQRGPSSSSSSLSLQVLEGP